MIKLKYGNTNTFYIPGENGGLLFDTDYAGTLPAFYKAIKQHNIAVKDIRYVLASHYHPDHMGIIGDLMEHGVKLLLPDVQINHVHFSDEIFLRDKTPFQPIDAASATVISCEESKAFLSGMGIGGEIIHTPSHSPDSISLILDDGTCLAGDLEPLEYLGAYGENEALQRDWDRIRSFALETVYFAHRPEKTMEPGQITRISHYEEIMDKARGLLAENVLNESLAAMIRELEAYYLSENWKKDFEDDENGRLPADLKRGVLSEDCVYDLLEEYRERLVTGRNSKDTDRS